MPTNIFFIHTGGETFTKIDCDLLGSFASVNDFYASRKFPRDISRYWHGVKEADVVFCWFASWNSFWALLLAKLLGKPSVLVIGGYDLANLPEADYGQQRGGLGKWVSRLAMKSATRLFTNSYYSQREAEQNAGLPAERVQVIYHGVPDPFLGMPDIAKERMALTVGNVDASNLKRKGLVPFVRTAALLPDVRFVLVGAWKDDSIDYLRSISAPNVEFTGRVIDSELLDYYRRASVYVQASLHEGFGMSVAEAMLAGCIPVVARAGSLPEVVGECGIFTASYVPHDLAASIQTALYALPELRLICRNYILTNYPLERRRKELLELISDLTGLSHK